MPLQAPSKLTQREQVSNFFGVNLRSDPSDIAQGGLAAGTNIDLYSTPGTLLVRRGFEDKTLDLNSPQRHIARANNGIVHAGAIELYVDGVSVSSSLVADVAVDILEFRGQNAQASEVFIANGTRTSDPSNPSGMLRYTPSTVGNWGLDPPAAAPAVSAVAAGSLTGSYMAKYTYARVVSGITVAESNPSSASAAQALTSEDLGVDVIASNDADVTNIFVYRTGASGSTYLFDQSVSNATATIESSQADGALGAAVDEENDIPVGATIMHALRDRIWTNDVTRGNRLRYTKRFFPESQPASNFIDITPETTTITAISSINGVLIVFTQTTKYRVIEQIANVTAVGEALPFFGGATSTFVFFELPSSRGCVAPDALVSVAPGIIYPTKDGVFLTTGTSQPEQLLSQSIQNLFIGVKQGGIAPIDFDNETNMVAEFHRGRYYLSYTSTESNDGSNDITAILIMSTGEWYFWNKGYTSFLFDDTNNEFLGGDNDGSLRKLEEVSATTDFTAADDILATATTPDRDGGDPLVQKLFLYARVDAQVVSTATLTADFYANDTLEKSFTITGDRTRKLLRLPASSRGFTWRMELSFTSDSGGKVHGVEAQWKTLIPS